MNETPGVSSLVADSSLSLWQIGGDGCGDGQGMCLAGLTEGHLDRCIIGENTPPSPSQQQNTSTKCNLLQKQTPKQIQ